MKASEILVLGGGPGGSTCAHELARQGIDVTILDRARFPRVKVCAGWITPPILHALELHPDDYPFTMQAYSAGAIYQSGRYHETHFNETMSYGIVRSEFDHFLLHRAREAGAKVHEGVNIRRIERLNSGVRLQATDGSEYHARAIVGAGGTHCPVARQWGELHRREPLIIAQESETRIGADVLRRLTPHYGTMELFTEPDSIGYGWYVTKGDWLNIGLGRFRQATDNFNAERDRFLNTLRGLGRLDGIENQLEDFRGHSYKLYDEIPRTLSGDNFLLIGDAGGFASKWAGEGIRPAVETGLIGARILTRALTENRFHADFLESYTKECQGLYGPQTLNAPGLLLSFLPRALKASMARGIVRNDRLRRKLVFEQAFGFEPVRLDEIKRNRAVNQIML